jgi:splicing suppressor protein 51
MPTDTPRTTYLPLSTAKSWYDYFTLISDKSMVKDLLSPDLQPLVGNDEMACALRAATDKSSMILTILAALEVLSGPRLATQEKLTLHLIGATAKELDALMLFEELLHLLPALKDLHCVFVGLEMPRPMLNADASANDGKIGLDSCAACTTAGRKRSMSMHKTSYHSFSSLASYSAPDLAVAFNTGHSQEDVSSWSPTIRLLSHAKFPTVFTTFNRKEMEEETAILAGLGVRFLVRGERNRWRSMRTLLEVAEEEENGVYCNNGYWYVIAGDDGK